MAKICFFSRINLVAARRNVRITLSSNQYCAFVTLQQSDLAVDGKNVG